MKKRTKNKVRYYDNPYQSEYLKAEREMIKSENEVAVALIKLCLVIVAVAILVSSLF